jgi:hypothetical protein
VGEKILKLGNDREKAEYMRRAVNKKDINKIAREYWARLREVGSSSSRKDFLCLFIHLIFHFCMDITLTAVHFFCFLIYTHGNRDLPPLF